jgi:LmbE family N-acetylglucosaminyl deacetylase
MATLVTFHAHPDDEAIATGGTMAKAAAAGHRVVLVTATGGECGEVAEGVLRPGETLAQRRADELATAARILGVARTELLGYRDSGMAGTPANDDPKCFWRADVEEAAARLAAILVEERAEVLTIYDERGNYGHPDHVQVHRVGARAGELAGIPRVYESAINRDEMLRLLRQAKEQGVPDLPDIEGVGFEMGLPESELTTAVDVSAHLDAKWAALMAHASQVPEDSFFRKMTPEAFAAAFGTEWYRRRGAPAGPRESDLFDGVRGDRQPSG